MAYGVLFSAKGERTVISFFTTWGEEIELSLSNSALRRLGKRLVAFSEGKRQRVRLRVTKDFFAVAERDYKGAPYLLRFEFVWENPTLLIPSDNEINYTGFAKEDIADFGRQLMEYGKTGRAAIGDPRGE